METVNGAYRPRFSRVIRSRAVKCPLCKKSFTYDTIKRLWGRATSAVGRADVAGSVTIETECCKGKLTYAQVKTLWGRATSAQRKTFGHGSGRPKGSYKKGAPRCPCGAMTLARAKARQPLGAHPQGTCGTN